MTRAAKTSERIHDIRVAGKRARAILKLIEPETGPAARKLHERLKRVSGSLTKARDGEIVLSTIQRLARGNEKLAKAAPRSIPRPPATELKRLTEELRKIGADIAALASAEATGPKMRLGLRKTFAKVKKLFDKCRKGGSQGKFHEWRKRSKDLLYQIETLAPDPSKREKRWIDCLKALSQHLGDMNDLALTLEVLGTRRSKVGKLKKRARREYGKNAKKAVKVARRFFRQGENSKISQWAI